MAESMDKLREEVARLSDQKAAMAEYQGVRLLKNEPTDAELAEQYRRELRDVLEPVRALMDKALSHGLVLQFNLGRTPPNPRHEITNVQVIKYL